VTREEITRMLADWSLERVGEPVDPEAKFTEIGLFDSFDVLELIVFAEKSFDTRFTAEDLANPRFATLAGMAEVICARAAPRG
jgi:acyl carrier protein